MSLYRKYRPLSFTEVIGQDHIVKTLNNQIKNSAVNHAYLFCGTRGTGKTTIAKIFANAVNCSSFDGKICKKCDFCQKINLAQSIDIHEIDAASNNRVEDVRDLIEKTKYPPTYSKYKVYIVDEVHMFSNSSFNAFLKTLEEPLPHVIFILCTTEPNKLPKTILSRVLRFDCRPVTQDNLEKFLTQIFKKESITATPEAIKMIAEQGNGSVRDTLSIAESVMALSSNITERDVIEVLGKVDRALLESLITSILNKDAKKLDTTLAEISRSSVNINLVIVDILRLLKSKFMETQNPTHAQAPQTTAQGAKILEIYKTFATLELSIKTALNPQILFEGACLMSLGG